MKNKNKTKLFCNYIDRPFDSRSCSLKDQNNSEWHAGQNVKILLSPLSPPVPNPLNLSFSSKFTVCWHSDTLTFKFAVHIMVLFHTPASMGETVAFDVRAAILWQVSGNIARLFLIILVNLNEKQKQN